MVFSFRILMLSENVYCAHTRTHTDIHTQTHAYTHILLNTHSEKNKHRHTRRKELKQTHTYTLIYTNTYSHILYVQTHSLRISFDESILLGATEEKQSRLKLLLSASLVSEEAAMRARPLGTGVHCTYSNNLYCTVLHFTELYCTVM